MEQNPEKQHRWDALFSDAENALDELTALPEDRPDSSANADRLDGSGEMIEIELGRLTFGPQERSSIRGGTILPLGKPVSPNVSLLYRDQKIADAVLMVKNGCLALQITAVEE